MKRSAVIISSYDEISNPYYAGGGAMAVKRIAESLSQHYSVTIISGNYPGAKAYTKNNITHKYIGPSFLGPRLSQLVYTLILPFYAVTLPYDAWVESFTPPFSSSFLPYFTKKPVIGFIQMLSGEDMKRKYHLPFPFIEKFAIKKYTNLIVLSDVFKKKIKKINPNAHISVIPIGIESIDKSAFKKGAYILCMGRLEYNQKGLDLLLKSFSQFSQKSNLNLVIAGIGSNQDTEHIKRDIKELKIGSRVQLVGKVLGSKKKKLLSDAAFVVIPSRFDTFPTVVLEAMSYAKPLVGFNIDGLSWLTAKSIIKAKRFNTKQLANNMYELSTDTNLRKEMGMFNRQLAKRFLWTAITPKYIETVKSVLNS